MNRAGLALALTLCLVLSCDRPAIEGDSPGIAGSDASLAEVDSGETVTPGSVCEDAPPLDKRLLTTDERVAVILSDMSFTEKVDQMAGVLPSSELFRTPDNEKARIRGFRFRDGPRGVRLEKGSATCFPVAVARAATWDLELELAVGAAIGAEVRGLEHNCLLAPTINTLRHPGWGRGQETYGEDPWLLGMMGIAFTRGAQAHVPVCVKHYAGNNIEDTRMTNDALIDEQTLRENYARQFEMVVKEADAACVMSAYNKVNGAYCSENVPLLRSLLKEEWGFDGFVVSDWFAAKSTVESALGGLDVEMPWRDWYDDLELAVGSGQVPEDVIDEAVERILRVKFRYGFALLDEPYTGDPEVVESDAHVALALKVAREGIVLLQNRADVLPLDRETSMRVAVVGPWADEARLGDAGSSAVTPSYAVTPYQGIAAAVAASPGVELSLSEDASAATGADVAIVVVALTTKDEGEAFNGGGDRDDLKLSEDQEQLILDAAEGAGAVIVVMEAGGPITMAAWQDAADGIVMAWYPGMEGGTAIAEILFGDEPPSGRLVQTWPARLEDSPVFGNHQDETTFDFYHGYRHADHQEIEPLFPFGFGLSTTTFSYENLRLPCEQITAAGQLDVTLEIENTGARAGVAVPQVYISVPESAARRPAKELKGFARVELAPGERRPVTIPVRVPDLAYWDGLTHAWVVEPIRHEVHVGPHAGELPLSGAFTIGDTGVASSEGGAS